jgi:hypothetical protein
MLVTMITSSKSKQGGEESEGSIPADYCEEVELLTVKREIIVTSDRFLPRAISFRFPNVQLPCTRARGHGVCAFSESDGDCE